eukprot:Lithocolla_globosa_v1_NODE_5047_length_1314_cov_8.469420.p1 type:complete len:263 gc:universal NODE_5047_length_1314_cov_8.469420:921-133(-)
MTGRTHPRLQELVKLEDLVEWYWVQIETRNLLLDDDSYHTKKLVKVTGIRDLTGLNYELAMNVTVLGTLKGALSQTLASYPEVLAKGFVVGAPGFFTFVWAMISPVLNQRTKDKIAIFGSSGFQEELLRVVSANNLPGILGGTCHCPNGCVEGQLPEGKDTHEHTSELYLKNGGFFELPLEIHHETVKVEWDFHVTSHDVKFEVFHQEKVVSSDLYHAKDGIHTGSHVVSVAEGSKVTLRWDNTHSYWNTKTVHYKARVTQS